VSPRHVRNLRPGLEALGEDPSLLVRIPYPPTGLAGDQFDPPISSSLMSVLMTVIKRRSRHPETPLPQPQSMASRIAYSVRKQHVWVSQRLHLGTRDPGVQARSIWARMYRISRILTVSQWSFSSFDVKSVAEG
jgi:hypothetical protein